MASTRILFMHGLEGHPNGSKVVLLRGMGFDVHAADMQMSVWSLRRSNSVLRQLLRSKELWGALAVTGLLLAGVGWSPWLVPAALLWASGWSALRLRTVAARAMGRSFDHCVAVQAQALHDYPPDIVIGSSWGGAVAAALLATGRWRGPTILLAPACQKISAWTFRHDIDATIEGLRTHCAGQPVRIFHDPTDDTVHYEHTVQLAQGAGLELCTVDAGGHRLLGLLESGQLADEIQELVGKGAEGRSAPLTRATP